MNKRLQELAKECGLYIAYENGQPITKEEMEEFAKLIVKECMQLADLPKNASKQWDHLEASEVIAAHFGVSSE